MSVTITAEMSAIAGHEITCGCAVQGPRFGDRADAVVEMVKMRDAGRSIDGCTDVEFCSTYLLVGAVEVDPAPYVNMSNTNAGLVLRLLGLHSDDDDLSGTTTGADLLARLDQAALFASAEPAVPTTVSGRNGNFIECGRSADYASERIADLREVADFCVRTGRKVTWA